MTSREFSEWMAYAAVEPFGEIRADMRAALIAQQVANKGATKKEDLVPLREFMLRFGDPEEIAAERAEQQQDAVRDRTRAFAMGGG